MLKLGGRAGEKYPGGRLPLNTGELTALVIWNVRAGTTSQFEFRAGGSLKMVGMCPGVCAAQLGATEVGSLERIFGLKLGSWEQFFTGICVSHCKS